MIGLNCGKGDLSRHEIERIVALADNTVADNALADRIVFDESRAGYVSEHGRLSGQPSISKDQL
jgi:hypothetical protein